MSRGALLAVLALDLLVAASSAYVLLDRVKKSFNPEPITASAHVGQVYEEPKPAPPSENVARSHPKGADAEEPSAPEKQKPVPPPPDKKAAKRNVTFQFRDPRAKRVSVIGAFNNWSPQLMKMDASHKWSLTLSIMEGRHAYNFIVDGKTIRDPSANGSENVPGRKIPSSILSVKGNP